MNPIELLHQLTNGSREKMAMLMANEDLQTIAQPIATARPKRRLFGHKKRKPNVGGIRNIGAPAAVTGQPVTQPVKRLKCKT